MYSNLHGVPYCVSSHRTKTTTESSEDSDKGHPVVLIVVFTLLILASVSGMCLSFAH